jgi:hypothetical protein
LADRLAGCYGPDHELIMYEASPYPIGEPLITRVRVGDLPTADVRPMVTMYVPPAIGPTVDPEASTILGAGPTEAEPVGCVDRPGG